MNIFKRFLSLSLLISCLFVRAQSADSAVQTYFNLQALCEEDVRKVGDLSNVKTKFMDIFRRGSTIHQRNQETFMRSLADVKKFRRFGRGKNYGHNIVGESKNYEEITRVAVHRSDRILTQLEEALAQLPRESQTKVYNALNEIPNDSVNARLINRLIREVKR